MIKLWCGLSSTEWNGTLPQPGYYACISPVKGASKKTRMPTRVNVPVDTLVLQDSGAFQDSIDTRLTFSEALERQIEHAEKWAYNVEARVSYDLLIDEVWKDGQRHKKRWSVQDAEKAVHETVAAAKFLSENRHNIEHLVLSVQGVDAKQYIKCTEQVLDHLDPKRDWLGLGGWCAVGKMPSVMMPVFRDTIRLLIPYLANKQVKHVHIFGVLYPYALGELLWMCDQFEISLSTDSAGGQLKPCFGDWGYGDWRDNNYKQAPVDLRSIDRRKHLEQTRRWLYDFRASQYYQEPKFIQDKIFSTGHKQLAFAI